MRGKIRHFESINELVKPDEIAPVLPFPCSNPRRTDNLILEYREVLFDQLRVEATNLIHAPEQNPFGVYREIVSAATHYIDAMEVFDGCKVVLSVLSSKLLSVGTLLAAYDLKQAGHTVGVAHVQAEGYSMGDESTLSDSPGDLFEIWDCRRAILCLKSSYPHRDHRSVCVGSGLVTLDIVFDDESPNEYMVGSGGSCGNVMSILSFLGWKAYPVTRLGQDQAAPHSPGRSRTIRGMHRIHQSRRECGHSVYHRGPAVSQEWAPYPFIHSEMSPLRELPAAVSRHFLRDDRAGDQRRRAHSGILL